MHKKARRWAGPAVSAPAARRDRTRSACDKAAVRVPPLEPSDIDRAVVPDFAGPQERPDGRVIERLGVHLIEVVDDRAGRQPRYFPERKLLRAKKHVRGA